MDVWANLNIKSACCYSPNEEVAVPMEIILLRSMQHKNIVTVRDCAFCKEKKPNLLVN